MATKKKKISRGSMDAGRTTAKKASSNRYKAQGYKGATRIGAGQRIAVENKRAGRRPNPKATKQAVFQAGRNAPSFVKSGSRAPGKGPRTSMKNQIGNARARMGREIMRQNQAVTTRKGTLRTTGGQRKVERAQAGRVGDFRAKLAGWNKAFAKASAAGDALSARKAKAGARALKAEYKAWRKGGSRVNASG